MLLLLSMFATAGPAVDVTPVEVPAVDVTVLGGQAMRSDVYSRLSPLLHGGLAARVTVGDKNPRVFTEIGWRALDYDIGSAEQPLRRSTRDLRWTVGGRFHLLPGTVGPSGPLVVPYFLFSAGLQVRYGVENDLFGGTPAFYSAGGAGVAVGGPVRLVLEVQGEYFIGPSHYDVAWLRSQRAYYDASGVGLLTTVGVQVSPRAFSMK